MLSSVIILLWSTVLENSVINVYPSHNILYIYHETDDYKSFENHFFLNAWPGSMNLARQLLAIQQSKYNNCVSWCIWKAWVPSSGQPCYCISKGSVPRCNTLIAFKQPWQLEKKTPGSCYEWLSGIFQLVYNIWEITNLSHDHGVAIFHNYFLFTKCRQRLNRPTVRDFVIITNTQPQLVPN